MKKIKYTFLYCLFLITFLIPFYYGSGTVINYGAGSNFLLSYGSGSGSDSTRQKIRLLRFRVPVPVPVQQHCLPAINLNLVGGLSFISSTFFMFFCGFQTGLLPCCLARF
jgi:hypothetical protein